VIAAEQCLYRIRRALAAVSPRTKDVFFMHRLHGLSYAQIADHFDLSISAVEKHIAKAMAELGPQMHQLYRELQGR
jgi:RNA polymerase sigma-70 factor (ECF subfamily)